MKTHYTVMSFFSLRVWDTKYRYVLALSYLPLHIGYTGYVCVSGLA